MISADLDARIRFADAVQAAVDREYAGVRATARKSGRNPAFPYVPVLAYAARPDGERDRTEVLVGLAFATRAAAVGDAERQLFERRAAFARKLCDPTHRALRESRGLPREVVPVLDWTGVTREGILRVSSTTT